MRIVHIQPEHQSAIVFYDIDLTLYYTEIEFDVLADFLGTFDCNLTHVEEYAEQYIQDQIKHHVRYENAQDYIDNQPYVAHLFKPYLINN